MEALYHKTNQTVMEIGECFQNLSRFKQSSTDTKSIESDIQEKINLAKNNCDRLDILVQKEPVTKRQNSKLKVDQLKYDIKHFQSSLTKYQVEKARKVNEEKEREELLNRRFTQNRAPEDTTIYIDYSLQHQKSLQTSNHGVDDLIHSGSNILTNLREQRNKLKGVHRRIMDIGNTLGLSNTTMRLIERRVKEDKFILFGGMIITSLFILIVIIYFT